MSYTETSPQISRRNLLIAAAGVTSSVVFADYMLTPGQQPVPETGVLPAEPATEPRPPAEYFKHHLPRDHFIRSGPEHRRRVAVTVDDFSQSYAPDYLAGLLQIGRETDTHFTLFPIGNSLAWQYDRSRHLWRQAVAQGHVIGNHTWDHDTNLAAGSRAHIESELVRQQQMVNKILGRRYDQYLMRPPGGSGGFPNGNPSSRNEQQHRQEMAVVRDLGYWMTMWTTDSNDAHGRMITPGDTPAQQDARFLHKIFHGVNGNTFERVANGSIILVHPNTLSLNGMRQLIAGLRQREYQCVTVPELFAPRRA